MCVCAYFLPRIDCRAWAARRARAALRLSRLYRVAVPGPNAVAPRVASRPRGLGLAPSPTARESLSLKSIKCRAGSGIRHMSTGAHARRLRVWQLGPRRVRAAPAAALSRTSFIRRFRFGGPPRSSFCGSRRNPAVNHPPSAAVRRLHDRREAPLRLRVAACAVLIGDARVGAGAPLGHRLEERGRRI